MSVYALYIGDDLIVDVDLDDLDHANAPEIKEAQDTPGSIIHRDDWMLCTNKAQLEELLEGCDNGTDY